MKRLSLEELKMKNFGSIQMLESIKGGNADGCHLDLDGNTTRTITPGQVRKQ